MHKIKAKSLIEFREAFIKENDFLTDEIKTFSKNNKNNNNNILQKGEYKFSTYKKASKNKVEYVKTHEKMGEFGLVIADYRIEKDFMIDFSNDEKILKFGIVYEGTSRFKINSKLDKFIPSAFMISEEKIKGIQVWKKGQHFKGTEIIISYKYINKLKRKHKDINFELLNKMKLNQTYKDIPIEVITSIYDIEKSSKKNELDSLIIEGEILKCLSMIIKYLKEKDLQKTSYFLEKNSNNMYKRLIIGKTRVIRLNNDDILAIKKAHDILTSNLANTPTINALSDIILLNQQKLKAGFKEIYNINIGEFIINNKMLHACELLTSTNLSIDEISNKIGYSYTSNFINAFKKRYNETPMKYKVKLNIK